MGAVELTSCTKLKDCQSSLGKATLLPAVGLRPAKLRVPRARTAGPPRTRRDCQSAIDGSSPPVARPPIPVRVRMLRRAALLCAMVVVSCAPEGTAVPISGAAGVAAAAGPTAHRRLFDALVRLANVPLFQLSQPSCILSTSAFPCF